jgi:hypothetical protein
MGLLDKTNPHATRKSVIRQAIIFSILTAVAYPIACVWMPLLRAAWPVFYPVAILLGAGIGALMEWQLDDSLDEGHGHEQPPGY